MNMTYSNPVYNHGFPDPFVLKYCGEYWGYATGIQPDGRCFGIMRSRNLTDWEALGGALEPLAEGWPYYWAPEVTYDNGRFYMYYSVGNEELMEIRVAVAEHPAGPFVDSGHRLTSEPFAIDAHVLVDEDGARYLFYATDFLQHTHIGTGTVVDRLLDPFTLEGQPRPVSRARYDWQIYDPQRKEKGGVRWHTVEGPFVLKRKGVYYQMFSGGNWQNPTYGVSYATTTNVNITEEWEQAADGNQVLPILRTIPGKVIGPGHNSVVRGPDNLQQFCVYHRWAEDKSGRVLAIDPLDWADKRMLIIGPSTTPQPAPTAPRFVDYFESPTELGQRWKINGGSWNVDSGVLVQQERSGAALVQCLEQAPCYVVEVSARALDTNSDGGYGVAIVGHNGVIFMALCEPHQQRVLVRVRDGEGWNEQAAPLLQNFNPHAFHLLRVELNGATVCVRLDDQPVWVGVAEPGSGIGLITEHCAAAFAGFSLTVGYEDLFTGELPLASTGWVLPSGDWSIQEQQLVARAMQSEATITKPLLQAPSYELIVNARLVQHTDNGSYGILAAAQAHTSGPLLSIERANEGWSLVCAQDQGKQQWPLPPEFDPMAAQQFRFRKLRGQLTVALEAQPIAEIEVPAEACYPSLYARHAEVAFEMVRFVQLP